jgi:mRNA deadenylase 3'-5' endonuclease subunit Ccr4
MVYQEHVEYNLRNVPHLNWIDRDNIGQLCLFRFRGESKEKEKLVLVANTHLLFNPKRLDIKLAQLKLLLQRSEEIHKRFANERTEIFFFFCGDLNMNEHSPVLKLLNTGRISGRSYLASLDSRYAGSLAKFLFDGEKKDSYFLHNYRFHDIHYHVHHMKLATTFHQKSLEKVDYVLFDASNPRLKVLSSLTLPSRDQAHHGLLGPGLPNEHFPSDHLLIGADFGFKPVGENKE